MIDSFGLGFCMYRVLQKGERDGGLECILIIENSLLPFHHHEDETRSHRDK